MCIAPQTLEDGTQIECRECWQCIKARVDDWCGRCIAEGKVSVATSAITLTYGRDGERGSKYYGSADHPSAAVLTYSDVQKYFKLLRSGWMADDNKPYPLRYFAVGEYGSMKGRAHWHVIIFWKKRVPPHEIEKRFMERHWPHGFSYWAPATFEDIRYNCKYINKGMGEDERQGHLAMSRLPPLGAEYFAARAREMARRGLVPLNYEYTFPEAVRRNGSRIVFRLRGRSQELFLQAYVDEFIRLHGPLCVLRGKERAAYVAANPGKGKEFPFKAELLGEFLEPHTWTDPVERRREK